MFTSQRKAWSSLTITPRTEGPRDGTPNNRIAGKGKVVALVDGPPPPQRLLSENEATMAVAGGFDQSPWSSKTPEKPLNPPRRLRNRGAALSLKEVRQFANTLQVQDPCNRSDPLSSPKQQISSPQSQTLSSKQKDPIAL